MFVTGAGDGSNRLFVVEKAGIIRLAPSRDVFVDITDRVESQGSEQGLLGLAFDPAFKTNGYFYVDYIGKDGNTVVSRFHANGDTADPASEKRILTVDQPAANHNGGMLAFGPDGYLYIALGDGGGEFDQYHTGQNPGTLLAKLLRIDVHHGDPYSVPKDNPFVRDSKFKAETWDWGLRNPWRFSFDKQTGDLYIGDVGQNHYEEIDVERKGHGGNNYGWSVMEGMHCLEGDSCDKSKYVLPVTEYSHDGGNCAVTGGYVYRGRKYSQMAGKYFFGDFCSGRIWSLTNEGGTWTQKQELQLSIAISSFGEDDSGELYVADLSTGDIYHLVAK